MKRKKINTKKKYGFTIIEILVALTVVATITIILAVAYKNISPYASSVTGEALEGKLNNAANEWMVLKIQSGVPTTRLTDLGSNIEEAINELKNPIIIDGETLTVSLPKNISIDKVKGLGIDFQNGEFTYTKPS